MPAKKKPSRASSSAVMRRIPIIFTVVGVVTVITFVVISIGGEGDAPTRLPVDPHTGLSEFDIPVQDPDLVAAGEVVFSLSCSECHGANLRGTPNGPSFLSVIYNPIHHSDAAFFSAARNGVKAHHWGFGDMAPVAGLTQEQLVDVVAFVREHQRVEGFETYPPQ